MIAMVRFGVAGNPPNFWRSSFSKERANSPYWLKSIGLDALEIQCTYGVRMPEKRIAMFKSNAKKAGIELSIHAPYYISLGASDTKKIDNSLIELYKAVVLAQKIDSQKIIFHVGSAYQDREKSLKRTILALSRFEKEIVMGDVRLYPEIAGKIGQIGSLKEILNICAKVECARPCLDLAHLHARSGGILTNKKAFVEVFNAIEDTLGLNALKHLHFHMYPIAWNKSGETSHKAFHDIDGETSQKTLFQSEHSRFFQPRYESLIELILEREIYPTIICEAKDSQDEGALEMKMFYMKCKKQLAY